MSARKKVLYAFHKSLTEPIPRLHGLAQVHALSAERPFCVLSFEPRRRSRSPDDLALYDETRTRLRDAGVRHSALPFLGSRWLEIPLGAAAIALAVLFRGVRIIHCRSYIPALMGLLVRWTGTALLFDMRGLFVDEYLFEGAFRENTFKLAFARWLERKLLLSSAAIVVVSEKFRDHLLARSDLAGRIRPERIHVIPNRSELPRFAVSVEERGRLRAERGWEGCTVAVYTGSISPWHRLGRAMEIMRRVMSVLSDVRLLVLTYPSTEGARSLASRAGIAMERASFATAEVADVPSLLVIGDVSLMLEARHLCRHVCAPIKFSEYVAAGLPVVANDGIGDVSGWVGEERLGLLVEPDEIEEAVHRVVEFLRSDEFRTGEVRARCLDFARRKMDMRDTLGEYEAIYQLLDGQ